MKYSKIFLVTILVLCSAASVIACNFHKSEQYIKMSYDNGIYHFVLDGEKLAGKIKFVSTETLVPNRKVHNDFKSVLTINTGFFDPKNQKTISYIVEDNGTKVLDPLENENLINNPILFANIDKLKNRTEFRVLECSGKAKYEITQHTSPIEEGCRIVTSAQGGPMVLPDLRLEEEFFVVKNMNSKVIRESASVLHKCARTVIGLKGKDIHILIFTNDAPADMLDVQKYCQNLKLEKAMAFDGGSSTSLNYKDIEVVSAKNYGRRLKSFLIVEE